MHIDPDFAWWNKALKGTASEPVSGEPQCGFYKMSSGKTEPAKAVAIWRENGRVVARVAMTFFEAEEVWDRCCRSPITYDEYMHFRATGSWKDHPATADGRLTRDLSKAAPIY